MWFSPDSTLAGISQLRPASVDELASVSGVGAKKLELYGEDVLRLVSAGVGEDGDAPNGRRYVDERDNGD